MPATAPAGYKRYLYSASYLATYPDGSLTECDDVDQSLTLCIDFAIDDKSGDKSGEAAEQLCNDTVKNAFQSAIALAEQDPLLQCVSSWLNQDFDWQPLTVKDSQEIETDLAPDIIPDVTLYSAKSTRHKIGLSFRNNIDCLPIFPAEFGEFVELQRRKQWLSLCLASLQLSDVDVQRLKPGSLVLLPDTFKDQYAVELFATPSGTSVAMARLDHRNCSLYFADDAMQPAQSTTAEAGSTTRIILQQAVSIDLSRLSESRNDNRPVSSDITDALAPTVVSLPAMDGQEVLVLQHHSNGVETYRASLLNVGSGLAAVLSGSD